MGEKFGLLLSERWRSLASSLGLDKTVADRAGDELARRYCGPDRHYHDARHIVSMLDGFERLRQKFEAPAAAQLAIVFHDLVYDPSRRDNEGRSAEAMVEMLDGTVDEDILAAARRSILATKTHAATPSRDTNLILDLDMAILGAPWAQYERYAVGIMREYLPVHGEQAYRQGRVALFLEPALERGVVYLTEEFQHLDAPAIQNIRREAEVLKSGGFFSCWHES